MYRVWELSEKEKGMIIMINIDLNEKEVEYLLAALTNETSRLRDKRINALENNKTGVNTKYANNIKERMDILDTIWEKVYLETI